MNNNQDNINSFLDSMDEAPADQFTAAENSFASPVGNPQQAPYTPTAVWPGEQQNEPVPQTAVQPTAPAPQTVPLEQAIPQQAPPMQVLTPPIAQSAAPQAVQQPTAPAVNTGAQQSMLDPFEQALNDAKNQQESRMLETLAAKPAFFSYGKVKESIEDREPTFEDLRAKYETDFPELSDGKLISWSVNYGKVPKQRISRAYIESETENEYPEHLIHVMDIHSHNIMPAVFSEIDDKDETATRLYAVAGRFDRVFPELTVRASCGGKFIPIDPSDIFDAQISGEFPNGWNDSIELTDGETRKSNRRFHRIQSERKHFFAGKYISEAGI